MNRISMLAGMATVLAVFTGCGKGQVKTYPVSGEVIVDGKPAEDVFIYLHTVTPENPPAFPTPFGKVEKDGRFVISTFGNGDGAPAGDYVVTFAWRARSGLMKQHFDGPDRFKGQYYDKEKSNFHVTIKKEPNALTKFELKAPK
jgi:hypothetical protein